MSDTKPYRAMVFHRTLPAKIVHSPADVIAALASGWADTPAVFADGYVPPVVEAARVDDPPATSEALAIVPSDAPDPGLAPPRRRGRPRAHETS